MAEFCESLSCKFLFHLSTIAVDSECFKFPELSKHWCWLSKDYGRQQSVKEYIETINSYGIEVQGGFLFGFDEQDANIFEETVRFVKEIRLDKIYPHMLIPFLGSETFRKLEQSGRILTKDWSKYDGTHVVHQPKNLAPNQLEQGVYWFWEKTTSLIDRVKYWLTG